MAQTSGVSLSGLDSITGGWPQCVCGNSDPGFDGRFLNKSYPHNQKIINRKHLYQAQPFGAASFFVFDTLLCLYSVPILLGSMCLKYHTVGQV